MKMLNAIAREKGKTNGDHENASRARARGSSDVSTQRRRQRSPIKVSAFQGESAPPFVAAIFAPSASPWVVANVWLAQPRGLPQHPPASRLLRQVKPLRPRVAS